MLDLIRRRRPELEELCQHDHVRRLQLFGSATDETSDPAQRFRFPRPIPAPGGRPHLLRLLRLQGGFGAAFRPNGRSRDAFRDSQSLLP